jgi:Transposase DDE domain
VVLEGQAVSTSVVSVENERLLFGQLLSPELLQLLEPDSPNAHYTPYVVLWLLIFQRLHANASLGDAVAEFLSQFPCDTPANQLPSANTGAYSQARTRLDTTVARIVTDHITQQLIDSTPPAGKQRHTFLFDGTTIQLPHTDELGRAFPPASNQHGPSHWPILHLLVAHELDSGLALRPEFGPMYGPDALSELDLALRLLPRLPADALVLADRNFGVFALAHAVAQSGRDVLVRLTQPRFKSLRKKGKAHEPGVWSLTWKPSAWERRQHPELPAGAEVSGWLHEVKVREDLTLWLFTTCSGPGEELAALYGHRVKVESDIRDLKQTLSMDQITAKGLGMVEKELVVGVLAFNLVNQVRRLAAREAGVEARRLSFAGVWSLVKAWLGAWQEGSSGSCENRLAQLLRWAAQRKLPKRATPRSYPRATIPRTSPYPKRKPKTIIQHVSC